MDLFEMFGFRPLHGDLISQSERGKRWIYLKCLVSVPFTGILFLNNADAERKDLGVK